MLEARRRLFLGVLLAAALVAPAAAEEAAVPAGFRADWLANFDDVARKAIELAEAIPPSALAWRPAEGVRSCGAVIAHLALANYTLPSFLGTPIPESVDRALEQESDPLVLRRTLADSIAHARGVVVAMSDEDLERRVKFFGGREVTGRELLLVALGHVHEHVGQLIAYARMNGIVPPWSAASS
ncbi:MAG TPA: DinB family protein [Thermoanaerobaculia bacterium]|nr:DinB family protein [Thermoanaerobaculia bacterium]